MLHSITIKEIKDKISKFNDEKKFYPILNRHDDLLTYDKLIIKNIPIMSGVSKDVEALHEIHIFLLPTWLPNQKIDDELINKYKKFITLFNETLFNESTLISYDNLKPMKDPVLALNFVNIGYVTVMQSSMYILSNSPASVINTCHQIAELFQFAGFQVVREKIEASAYGITNIPQEDDNAIKYGKYFEFHVRVQRKDMTNYEALTNEETKELENVSLKLSKQYGIPVPLSFNRSKEGTEGGYQRYLNLRFRNMGMTNIKSHLNNVTKTIIDETQFKVVKIISEYVWYDTYVDMDQGWIDFLVKPKVYLLSGKRFSGKSTVTNILKTLHSNEKVCVTSFSYFLKKEFCVESGLDLDRFVTDHKYKDSYRTQLTAFFDSKGPAVYSKLLTEFITKSYNDKLYDVFIVDDARYKEYNIECIKKMFNNLWDIITIRVNASDETKEKRGWIKSSYDSHICENDLDDYNKFDYIISNDGTFDELYNQVQHIK